MDARTLEVGISIIPYADSLDRSRELVRVADEGGAGNAQIDAAAEKAGRDPRSIRRIINVQGVIGEQPAPPGSSLRVGYLAGEPLAGPAEWWAETIAGLAADGFDTIVFWPVDRSPSQVELLVGAVAPQLAITPGARGHAG